MGNSVKSLSARCASSAPPTWRRIASALLASAAILLGRTAEAQFDRIQCSFCPNYTQFNWTYGIRADGAPDATIPVAMELPTEPPANCASTPTNPCPHYINWLDHDRYFVGNGYIKQFGLRFGTFDLEPNYDTFSFGEAGTTLTQLTGSPTLTWYDTTVSQSLQATPGRTFLHVDGTVTYRGLTIDQARVCCQSTLADGDVAMEPAKRYSGVLLGSGDTVYFKVPVSCGAIEQTWNLWGAPSTASDFDVYVRCNARPTPSAWDFVGLSSNAQEHVRAGAYNCSCPGTWYVAVHSYSGSGMFHLVTQSHFVAERRTVRAGTAFSASSLQGALLGNALGEGCKQLFGLTEGAEYIQQIDFYNNADCGNCAGSSCDICLHDEDGPTGVHGLCTTDPIHLYHNAWLEPEDIGHELAHKYFCVDDEYYYDSEGFSIPQCGHSVMAVARGSNNNLCYFDTAFLREDHTRDKPPWAISTTLPHAWKQAQDAFVTPWIPSQTPDNYDYRDHDLNALACKVVFH